MVPQPGPTRACMYPKLLVFPDLKTSRNGVLFMMLIPDVCCANLSGMCSLVPPSDVNLVPRRSLQSHL